jgi:hypothetical protein
LKISPKKTIGVVLFRLRQRLEIWCNVNKVENEKNWREIVEKNFYKALDHRSFYFKCNEKRLTNAKSFLDDAKARYAKRHEHRLDFLRYKETGAHEDYEFVGGSRTQPFFSSFMGFSFGPFHSSLDNDEIWTYSIEDERAVYSNAAERFRLPEVRMIFEDQAVFFDALRIVIIAIPPGMKKVRKLLLKLYQDFM